MQNDPESIAIVVTNVIKVKGRGFRLHNVTNKTKASHVDRLLVNSAQ